MINFHRAKEPKAKTINTELSGKQGWAIFYGKTMGYNP